MNQLSLFSKDRNVTLRRSKNQIATYYDVLTENDDKISYSEHIDPHKGYAICQMEYEEYVDIKKENLNGITFNQLFIFLKNSEPHKRLENLKSFLSKRFIKYESDVFTWHNEDL